METCGIVESENVCMDLGSSDDELVVLSVVSHCTAVQLTPDTVQLRL